MLKSTVPLYLTILTQVLRSREASTLVLLFRMSSYAVKTATVPAGGVFASLDVAA